MTPPTLLRVDGLFPPWVRWGFTTRHGGVSTGPYESLNLGWDVGDDPSAVRENHRRIAEALGYDPETLATVRQVHGRRVHVLRRPDDGRALRGRQGDGIVLVAGRGASGGSRASTEEHVRHEASGFGERIPGAGNPHPPPSPTALAALVRTADCCPVVVAALEHTAAAVLHCGWRSTVRGLVGEAVRRLAGELDDPRPALAAAIGPCIGPEAFEVGEEVAAAFGEKVSLDVVLRRPGRSKPHIDLQAALRCLLIRAGVPDDRIAVVRRCTLSEPADFFSFRRNGHDSGRQGGVVALLS